MCLSRSIAFLLLLVPSLAQALPRFTETTTGGWTFHQTPNSQTFLAEPKYAPTPPNETADAAAARLIRDGIYTEGIGANNLANLAQAEQDNNNQEQTLQQRNTDISRQLITEENPATRTALMKERNENLQKIEDLNQRLQSLNELKEQANKQVALGQEMQANGQRMQKALADAGPGCKGGCGGGGGRGGGGGGGGGGALLGAALGAAALGAALGAMAAAGGGDDEGERAFQDKLAKMKEDDKNEAIDDAIEKSKADDFAKNQDDRTFLASSGGTSSGITALLNDLYKDSKSPGSASTLTGSNPKNFYVAYGPPPPGKGPVGVVDLTVVRCFRMPGRVAVACQRGVAQLCFNAVGDVLPCP